MSATVTVLRSSDPWQSAGNVYNDVLGQFERVIVGRGDLFQALFIALVSSGHILIEGDAGTGKTESAKTFARLLDVDFNRIQFTPDLMPASITGGHIFNQKTSDFEFREGPIFANVVLGDEINRSSPKAQAATLEAMAERQISSQGETYELPNPFLLIATQNPLEYEGTFPLPLNQEDRFLLWVPVQRITDMAMLSEIATRNLNGGVDVEAKMDAALVAEFRTLRKDVVISSQMLNYMSRVIGAVNEHSAVESGPGERAMIAMARVAQTHAMINRRSEVQVQDVIARAMNVLIHRTHLSEDAEMDTTVEEILIESINNVSAPKRRK